MLLEDVLPRVLRVYHLRNVCATWREEIGRRDRDREIREIREQSDPFQSLGRDSDSSDAARRRDRVASVSIPWARVRRVD